MPQNQFDGIQELRKTQPKIAAALSRPESDLPMTTLNFSMNTVLFLEPVMFFFSFQVPRDFGGTLALKAALEVEFRETIAHHGDGLNSLMSKDKFRPSELTDQQICDSFEYVLVPGIGWDVYCSEAPVFRFWVHLRRPFNHDVEIGEVISTDALGNPR